MTIRSRSSCQEFPVGWRSQKGAALVVVLLLLLVVTLLGLASMRGTLLEERMSGAMMDRGLMFQAAEAALREGEAMAASSRIADYPVDCNNEGLCGPPNPSAQDDWVDRWNQQNPPYRAATTVTSGDLQVTPEYFIEYMGEFPNWVGCDRSAPMPVGCMGPRYRITARARAPGRSEVVLQSSYTSPE